MKRYAPLAASQKLAYLPWFFLGLIAFTLSVVIGLLVVPRSLAAEETMVIYQTEDNKVFGSEIRLNIFDKRIDTNGQTVDSLSPDGKKIIHPFTRGSYSFAVENTSSGVELDYELYVVSLNEHDIPLVFNIKKNGVYIFGDAGNKLRLGEGVDAAGDPDPEVLPGNLRGRGTDLYTMEWEWDTDTDQIDTDEFGNAAMREDLEYTIIFTAGGEGSVLPTSRPSTPTTIVTEPPETEIPVTEPPVTPPETDHGIAKPPTPSETFIPSPEETAPGTPQPASRPRTSDNTPVFLWVTILLICMSLLMVLVFFKKRKR